VAQLIKAGCRVEDLNRGTMDLNRIMNRVSQETDFVTRKKPRKKPVDEKPAVGVAGGAGVEGGVGVSEELVGGGGGEGVTEVDGHGGINININVGNVEEVDSKQFDYKVR
jgi:hypothetical protein